MSISGYQVATLLQDFRKRYGYKRNPEHGVDSLEISQEAQNEAAHLQNYFLRPKPQISWVSPKNVLDLIANQTKYPTVVEYEQQRRAGLFLEPIYVPPNPPASIDLVRDFSQKLEKPQEAVNIPQVPTKPSSPEFEKTEEKKTELEKPATMEPLQNIDIEEDIEDFMITEEKKAEEDNGVIFGSGKVTLSSMIEFIQNNTDSAIKFMAQRELDGQPLATNILDIHQKWQKRGLSRRAVREYILEIMGWKVFPEESLYTIWSEVRDRIYDLKHQ